MSHLQERQHWASEVVGKQGNEPKPSSIALQAVKHCFLLARETERRSQAKWESVSSFGSKGLLRWLRLAATLGRPGDS